MGTSDDGFYEYEGFIIRETDKAIGIGPDDSVEMWLPKSKVEAITYIEGGDSDEIRVGAKIEAVAIPEWLAQAKELTE